MPIAYGYARVSHDNSARSGLSEDTQRDVIQQYYQNRLAPEGIDWGMTFFDPAVSARHVPFLDRKEAAKLNAILQPGDHIIVAHLDRFFRAILDFASVLENVWEPKKIGVHFADMAIDLGTPAGRMTAHIMATIAQWQSDSYSERNKEVAARLKRLNRPTNGQKRMGWKLVGPPKHRQWAPDHAERRDMATIVRLRDEKKMSWDEISDELERRACQKEDRVYRKSAFVKRTWSRSRCQKAYYRAREPGFGKLPARTSDG